MTANDPSASPAKVSGDCLNQLFLEARTHAEWLPKHVSEHILKELYNTMRFGPTSANGSPARFVFLTSAEAKARLLPAMSPGNTAKTQSAPVNVIVAWDTEFYEKFPKLFPIRDIRGGFAANPGMAAENAFRNGSLQGGYFMLAARALGLDCGPMSGFDQEKVNTEFFPDGKWKVNFICNLGYGDKAKLFPRLPRLDFEEACVIL